MKKLLLLVILTALPLWGGLGGVSLAQTKTPVDGYPRFALGADVSWTPYIEQNKKYTYYNSNGEVTAVPAMLNDYGIDAIRLRVWVNPNSAKAKAGFWFTAYGKSYEASATFGTCTADEMVTLAQRLAMQGHRLMVCFHLSDTWADPGKQFIPEDWANCNSVNELSNKAVEHVKEVLTMLHERDVNVAWVQIGNETNNGMLKWKIPTTGQTVSSVSWGCEIENNAATNNNFVKVFGDVAKAAKEIYPEAKAVLHLANSDDWSKLNWTLTQLRQAGLSTEKCDYIGLSLYPGINDGREDYTAEWKKYADLAITTINNIRRNYGFRTIICETGMNNEWSASTSAGDQASNIKQCSKDVREFTQYLIDNLDTAESACDGLFYWEPETDYMNGYKKGACVAKNPSSSWSRTNLVANDWWKTIKEHSTFPAGGLKDYALSDNSAVNGVETDGDDASYTFYTIDGRKVSTTEKPGIYILHPSKGSSQSRKIVVSK